MNRLTTMMNNINIELLGEITVTISLIIVLLIIANTRIVDRWKSQV